MKGFTREYVDMMQLYSLSCQQSPLVRHDMYFRLFPYFVVVMHGARNNLDHGKIIKEYAIRYVIAS